MPYLPDLVEKLVVTMATSPSIHGRELAIRLVEKLVVNVCLIVLAGGHNSPIYVRHLILLPSR